GAGFIDGGWVGLVGNRGDHPGPPLCRLDRFRARPDRGGGCHLRHPRHRGKLKTASARQQTEDAMTAYLQIDHLDKNFSRGAQETEVLRDITLTIRKGEYASIIGHSGCGKSTLLNVVAGLTAATRRGVILEGREVDEP